MEKSATTNQRSTFQISQFVGEMNKIMKIAAISKGATSGNAFRKFNCNK
jgi:hypothetical protein